MSVGPSDRPVYIGGLDRSGKTTLAAFLTSHSRISIPGVGSNMWTYFYGQFGDLSEDDNLERCLEAMLRYKHVRYLDPDPDRIRSEFKAGAPTYGRLFALFLMHFAEREGKARWGAQTGLIERYADELFEAYPGAQVIHMVRDPRDRYGASLARWPEGKGRAGGAVARWRYSVKLGERNKSRYGESQYLILRFEDLVAEPEGSVRRVCEFLGEAFQPSMMEMAEAPTLRAKLGMSEQPNGDRPPLSAEYVGMYREQIPPLEAAFIENQVGSLMRQYGYDSDRTLTASNRFAFFAYEWPNQVARMLAWRGFEMIQHHLPGTFGRRPGSRMILDEADSP